ncbi:MAG TPA: type IX secretion system sortase PorU, partial [Bacteroidota bacterium]
MVKYFLIALALTTSAVAQPAGDVNVLKEDSRSLTLEFTPRYSIRTVKSVDGRELKCVIFQSQINEDSRPGTPRISYRGIPLQFPTSRVSVSVVSSESKTMNDVRPIPVPTMIPDPKFGLSPSYASTVAGKTPARSLASVTDVGPSQGKFMGLLRIYPVEYDEDAGNARLVTRIVVTIEFDPWPGPGLRASQPVAGFVGHAVSRSGVAGNQKIAGGSPLALGTWYKMEIRQTGIYRIDQSYLKKANISVSDINSVRIFGNGGRMLPEDLSQPRPNGLVEVARFVVDNNGNGLFDADDYVLFYGCSTRGWDYNPLTQAYSHYINNYSEPNEYFLTFGGTPGVSMDSVASTNIAGAYTPSDFQEKILLKQELHNLLGEAGFGAGRQWVGQHFDYSSTAAVYTNSLPGFVPGLPVQYRFVFLTHSASVDTFTVFESGRQLGNPILMYTVNVDPGNNVSEYAWISPQVNVSSTGIIADNRSVVKIQFGTNNSSAAGWIDYMDLLYRRSFDAAGNALLFDTPDTSGVVEYVVRNLPTSNVFVFDVTNQNSVKRITQVRTDIADGTVRRFQLSQTAGSIRKIAVVGLSGTLTPTRIAAVPNTNLHGLTAGADFVIIAPGVFAQQAERLRSYRESHDSLKSIVADIDDIYNEFSGGLQDPTAIRDFLEYAVVNWTVKPRYVLLFGNGHYDYKNIVSSLPNLIPAYESVESNVAINSYCTDDAFVVLDAGDPRTSIAIGRIPARSVDDATTMVDKIIGYETNAPFDTWRNIITYVGDDGLTSRGDDGDIHTAQAEDLAVYHTPDSFEKRKIYLSMYPTVLGASGRTKPQVNKDIVSAVNRGTLIMNFAGHGNTQLWTHEAVFTQASDLPQLVNANKPIFLVAATCNFGQYDDPNDLSAGVQILLMNGGGAVSEVTSSRAVYQGLNETFNNLFYDYLFPRDPQGNPRRLG